MQIVSVTTVTNRILSKSLHKKHLDFYNRVVYKASSKNINV